MSTIGISQYYDASQNSVVRAELEQAANLVQGPKIAIDCGCGAGSDITYLLAEGFEVHAFDIEAEAIDRCNARFGNEANLHLSQNTFSTFSYPKSSLVVADASLFFCPEDEFDEVWSKIYQAYIFCCCEKKAKLSLVILPMQSLSY